MLQVMEQILIVSVQQCMLTVIIILQNQWHILMATGTVEFSSIPAGSTVKFYIGVSIDDTVNIKF